MKYGRKMDNGVKYLIRICPIGRSKILSMICWWCLKCNHRRDEYSTRLQIFSIKALLIHLLCLLTHRGHMTTTTAFKHKVSTFSRGPLSRNDFISLHLRRIGHGSNKTRTEQRVGRHRWLSQQLNQRSGLQEAGSGCQAVCAGRCGSW